MKITVLSERGSGSPDKLNEDSFINQGNTYGVFDGAGSFTKYIDEKNRTGGYLASNIAAKNFSDESKSLLTSAYEANKNIQETMIEKGIDVSQGVNRWSTTIAVVRLNKDTFGWVYIGDSVILIIRRDGSHDLLSPYHNHDVEVLQLVKSLSGKDIGNLWEYEPFIKASTILQNNRNITYGVLDGSENAKKFISTGTESLKDIAHILLFTDGFLIPQENPDGKEDFQSLVSIFLKSGVDGLKQCIQEIQNSDPKSWKYPRFRQRDDLTMVAISF